MSFFGIWFVGTVMATIVGVFLVQEEPFEKESVWTTLAVGCATGLGLATMMAFGEWPSGSRRRREGFRVIDLGHRCNVLELLSSDEDTVESPFRHFLEHSVEQRQPFSLFRFTWESREKFHYLAERLCEFDEFELWDSLGEAEQRGELLLVRAQRTPALEALLARYRTACCGTAASNSDPVVFPGPVRWEADLDIAPNETLLVVHPGGTRIVQLFPKRDEAPA